MAPSHLLRILIVSRQWRSQCPSLPTFSQWRGIAVARSEPGRARTA
jgi:hypothetical protein